MRSSEIWLYKEVLHELKGKAARKQRRCTGMHVCSHIHTHTRGDPGSGDGGRESESEEQEACGFWAVLGTGLPLS